MIKWILDTSFVQLSYSSIFYFWTNFLWKDRVTPIPAVSHMTLERTFSDNISDPIYYGAVMGDRIVGVNSVHHIDDTVRSRGLWVNPEYRNRGIGQNLLKHAITLAGDSVIWSFPRSEALSVYQKAGFKVCSEELIDTVDNKKNFYVKHATDNS